MLATADALRTAHATAIPGLSCGGRDFNFFEDIFLKGADLFETNQLEEREKRHHYFDARHDLSEQVRKTKWSASPDPPQNDIDLLRNTKTLAKNLLHLLSGLDPLDYRLEGVDELKNPNFSKAQRFLQS
jgi:hypothetical protein